MRWFGGREEEGIFCHKFVDRKILTWERRGEIGSTDENAS